MTDSEKIILEFLADNRPASAYDIHKQTELIKQTARSALKRLHEKELLSQHEEPAEKSPHPKKVYSLTPLGILKAVGEYDVNIENLGKTHGEKLPLVLGKYDFYKQQDLEKIISLVLKKVFEDDLDAVKASETEERAEAVADLFYYRLIRDLAETSTDNPVLPELKVPDIRELYSKNWEEILDLLIEDEDVKNKIMKEILRQCSKESEYKKMRSFLIDKIGSEDARVFFDQYDWVVGSDQDGRTEDEERA